MPALVTGLAFAAPFAAASVVYACLRVSRRLATIAFALLAVPELAAPLLVAPDERFTRCLCAIVAAAGVFKTIDLLNPRTPVPTLRAFAAYLGNPTSMVLRRLDAEPSFPVRENLRRIARGSAQALVGAAALAGVYRLHLERVSFALEHAVKMLVLYVVVLGVLDVVVSIQRLATGKGRDLMHDIYRARSPAEFWRRYNRAVGQFFAENLFPYVGGLRRPVRATLLVFVASSILHEYIFGIANGRIEGWQTAFFMLHGVAVAATLRARPRGRAVLATAATAAFTLTSSVLFVQSVQPIIPIWGAP